MPLLMTRTLTQLWQLHGSIHRCWLRCDLHPSMDGICSRVMNADTMLQYISLLAIPPNLCLHNCQRAVHSPALMLQRLFSSIVPYAPAIAIAGAHEGILPMQEQQHAAEVAEAKLVNLEREMARAAKRAKSELRQRTDENADLLREVQELQEAKDDLTQQLSAAQAALKAATRSTPRGMPVSTMSVSCMCSAHSLSRGWPAVLSC